MTLAQGKTMPVTHPAGLLGTTTAVGEPGRAPSPLVILVGFLLFLICAAGHAQSVQVNQIGYPNMAPGTSLTICAFGPGVDPGFDDSVGGVQVGPCTNKKAIFSDPALTIPAANPVVTDSLGRFTFYTDTAAFVVSQIAPDGVFSPFFQSELGNLNLVPAMDFPAQGNDGTTLPGSDYLSVSKPQYASILKALHNTANGGVARILVIGDSRSIADSTITSAGGGLVAFGNRWADLLRTTLQSVYGSHGTGMVPVLWHQDASPLNEPNKDYYATSATLGNDCSLGPSLSTARFCGVATLPAGSTMTFSTAIPYDHLRAYCEKLPSSGTLSVSIDGASSQTLCTGTSTPAAVSVQTSSAVSLGTHTAALTCASGGGACALYAVEGVAGTSGVSVDNVSVASAALGIFASAPTTQFAFSDAIPEGDQLVIETHHTNEPGDGESTTQFQTELTNLITHEQGLASSPSIEMVALSQDDIGGQAPFYPIIFTVATSHGVGFVDVRNRTGVADDATLFGSEGAHENSGGNQTNFAMISAPFTDPAPSGNNSGSSSVSSASGNATSTISAGTNGAGTAASQVFVAPGADSFQNVTYSSGNGAGLAGVHGLYDNTRNGFVWNTNAAGDMCFGTPVSAGNVSGCVGADFVWSSANQQLSIGNVSGTDEIFNVGYFGHCLGFNRNCNTGDIYNTAGHGWDIVHSMSTDPAADKLVIESYSPNKTQLGINLTIYADGLISLGKNNNMFINQNGYLVGPPTAPTGSCASTGFSFSQDGHVSFCNGSVWVQKI